MIDKIMFEAVNRNLEMRERMLLSEYDKTIPKEIWLKDFCTIHLNIGRCTGKTFHIAENAKETDVVFVGLNSTRSLILDKNKRLNRVDENLINLNNLMWSHNKKRDVYDSCNMIFVDEPKISLKRFDNILDFYRLFINNKNEMIFILLGE